MLLSDGDGSHRLLLDALALALKVRRSPEAVLSCHVFSIITSCDEVLNAPRPHFTEWDTATGKLLLRFQGAATAYAAHKELRLICTSYLRQILLLAPFQPLSAPACPTNSRTWREEETSGMALPLAVRHGNRRGLRFRGGVCLSPHGGHEAIVTDKAMMGVGGAEITSLQNKGVGKGLLPSIP